MKIRISSVMTRVIARAAPIAFMAIGVWLWAELRPVRHPQGVLVEGGPAMIPATAMPLPSREGAGEFLIQRMARVHAQGRVLSIRRYRDRAAPLAPVDLVIGWGAMSDSQVVERVEVIQDERQYRLQWRGDQERVSMAEAMAQSVNLHLIPGTPEAAAFIGQIKEGALVDLKGALVEAAHGEEHWRGTLVEDGSLPDDAKRDLSGNRLVFLSEGSFFQGRSSQDLRSRTFQDHAALETADLQLWFEALKRRRDRLDVSDALAVREFNREAARYMSAAHPNPSRTGTAPAALRNAPRPASTPAPKVR